MRCQFESRVSAPGGWWYQIEPKGEHVNRPYGVCQVIDDEAIQAS